MGGGEGEDEIMVSLALNPLLTFPSPDRGDDKPLDHREGSQRGTKLSAYHITHPLLDRLVRSLQSLECYCVN